MYRENATLTDARCKVMRGERSESPVRPRRRRWWSDGLIALLISACLLAPVITLMIDGLTTTGNAEESVGRRYFYSLRILYGDHERPWAPQGQLVSVVHLAIQAVLTAVGFPPTQLFPRIDVFVQAASILPIVLTVLAFIWAIRPVTSPLAKLLIALGFLLVVFDSATTRGYHLVTPDYYSWVHAVALVGVGACLRVARSRTSLGLQSGCWLGAYAATAVSIKPTYLTFIVPLAILLLTYGVARRQWAGIGLGMLVSFAIVVVGTLAVHLAYYGGDIDALAQHVMNLTGFVDGIARPMSFPAWLIMGLARWRDGATLPASIALIPLLVLSAVLLPNRAVSVGLLAGAALNLYVAWRRYHPNTLIETNDFTFLAAVVWAALVMEPALRAFPGLVALRLPRWSRTRPAPLQTAGLILALVLGARAVGQVIGGVAEVRRSFGAATTGDRALAAYLESRSGDVAFLIPDNDLRPLTVDSAIYKGGTNEIGAAWGGSPYVHAMFPGRHYFVGGLDPVRDPDLGQFRHIVFVRLPTDRDDADVAERLRKTFRIWLGGYDCDFRADLIYQEIVACERRVVSLAANGEPKARFVPVHEDPSPEAMEQYRDPDAAPTEFLATQRVMGGGLDVWQLHADGSLALVDAPDGARVWIEDIGVWDSASRALTGVNATYIGGRPRLDVLAPAASNTNSRFDRYGSRRQPLYGWQLEPRDDLPVVERLSDEEGQFIRVRPAAEGTAVTLYSRAPLSKLDDTPVTVRAVVRVHGSQPITLAISDVTGRDGRASVRWVSTKSSDRWETVSVWLHRASSPDERDSFSVRLSNPASGSWMDLREVSLVEGIVP